VFLSYKSIIGIIIFFREGIIIFTWLLWYSYYDLSVYV